MTSELAMVTQWVRVQDGAFAASFASAFRRQVAQAAGLPTTDVDILSIGQGDVAVQAVVCPSPPRNLLNISIGTTPPLVLIFTTPPNALPSH